MDESDRLSQFIEDRAKDTLLRFARRRQERQSVGQINPRLASFTTPRRVSVHACVCCIIVCIDRFGVEIRKSCKGPCVYLMVASIAATTG